MIISVSNLKINNQPANSVVKITEPFPIINWDYDLIQRVNIYDSQIASTYQASAYGYEIRVGSSTNQIGTNSFDGDLAYTGFVQNTATYWRFRGDTLERGRTYYGQIRVTDSLGNTSDWQTFGIAYNSLPSIINAAITPNFPTVHDNLNLSYTFSDPDGDLESGSQIWWYKNGIHNRDLDGLLVINSSNLTLDDVWSAQIFPSDGLEIGPSYSTYTVSITTTPPVATNATILPVNPTYNDPLYAQYSFASVNSEKDNSLIQWYVNGNLIPNKNTAFVRLQLNAGDQVHYDIQPNDGAIDGNWVSSPTVTIQTTTYVVENLRCNGETEPMNSTLTPSITWSTSGPNTIPGKMSILIGTAPGSNNVFDTGFTANSLGLFTIPQGVLENGMDYYISVALGDSTFGNYTTMHVRTSGSRWQQNVSNASGWTIESTLRVYSTALGYSSSSANSSSSSSSPALSNTYQGIRIYDGSKFAEIRIYTDRVTLNSSSIITYTTDGTALATYTIIGKGSDIKVFKNFQLVIDGTGLFLTTTNSSLLEFGAIGSSANTAGQYLDFSYTTQGAFDPTTSDQYYINQFSNIVSVDGSIDYITGSQNSIYFSVSEQPVKSSTIYEFLPNIAPATVYPSKSSVFNVNSIRTSENGEHISICHDNGITLFNGQLFNYDVMTTGDPVANGWNLTRSNGSNYSIIDGDLIIDTTNGGKLFFSQSEKGTMWFNADNSVGWTLSFSLSVNDIVDKTTTALTDTPNGFGIYINDGTYQEVIQFYKNQILIKYAGSYIAFDTTKQRQYVVTGVGKTLTLYYQNNENEYKILASVGLAELATAEGNGGKPAITKDSNDNLHTAWHDDGDQNLNIYYSTKTSSGWSAPLLIASGNYDCKNPDIIVDNDNNIFVVFESSKEDNTDIFMVVRSTFGWSEPFAVDFGQFESAKPKLALDTNGNIHLVWEDHRNIAGGIFYRVRTVVDGKWSAPIQLSTIGLNAFRPAISCLGESVFVSYTIRDQNNNANIFLSMYNGGIWQNSIQISNGSNADFSDLVCQPEDEISYIVWQDDQSGNYQIYTTSITLTATVATIQQLTSNSYVCRFPKIGVRLGTDGYANNMYVAFEATQQISDTINSFVGIARYEQNSGTWKINSDVSLAPNDLRQMTAPILPKYFAGNADILYESAYATSNDTYIAYADKFVNIKDAIYNLSTSSPVSLASLDVDLAVSGQVERKEIRFGDFSDAYGIAMDFRYFNYFVSGAIPPFSATLQFEGTKVNDAQVNDLGHTWIAANNGLSFYFADGRIAKFTQGLFSNGSISAVGFDLNNIMYVVADGNIYISYDHLNFYAAFTFITDANAISFDSDNTLWVGTNSGIYAVNVWAATTTLPKNGSNVIYGPVTTSSSSSGSTSSSSSGGTAGGNEIRSDLTSGTVNYALVLNLNASLVWNNATASFESVNSPSIGSDWASFAIPMSETQIPGTFVANFPTAITTAGTYVIYIYLQRGDSPSKSVDIKLQQGEVQWNGYQEDGYVLINTNTSNGSGTTGTTVVISGCEVNTQLGYSTFTVACGMPSNNVRKIYVDPLDQVWAATDNGLVVLNGQYLTVYSTDNSGLQSNDIKDIGIVSSSIRYVATSNGLSKMFGNTFSQILFSDAQWSNDTTAVAWVGPRTLWVGGGGYVYQIDIDPATLEMNLTTFQPTDYANYTIPCENSQKFYFNQLDTSNLLQVFVNNRLVDNGYKIGKNSLVFDSPLLSSDEVTISIRTDIVKVASLQQNKAEQIYYGNVFRDMKKFIITDSNIYGITSGDKNQIINCDTSTVRTTPYDSIVLDDIPPVGQLVYVDQVDGNTVDLTFQNASDNLSGIVNMKVANYPNLSSDGTTLLPWVPFQNSFQFSLGDTLGDTFVQLTFTGTIGRRLCQFNNELYAGCASPAAIYYYNTTTTIWNYITTLDPTVSSTSIEFMIVYKNALYIGTSSNNGGKLWSSSDGVNWTTIVSYPGNAYAATILNDLLYIGTDGDEGGQLFTFDSVNSTRIANKVGSVIYCLCAVGSLVYIGTGASGIIYSWDSSSNRLTLVVRDRDTEITALGTVLVQPLTSDVQHPDPNVYVFAGTGTQGRILKSINSAPFNISYSSLPTKVTAFALDANGILNVAIGNNIYNYNNQSWGIVFSNDTLIEDIYFDQAGYTLISASGIKRVNNTPAKKYIYFSLQDAAGNVSVVQSVLQNGLQGIDLTTITTFFNQNRLLELDEYGQRVWNYDGTSPFYSGDKVIQENGIYYSQIFNGTSDLVTWSSISWDAIVPDNTNLTISVRTSDNRTDIETASWAKTFTKDQFQGGDISNLGGQFIQFMVTLSSTVRGLSPTLYKVNIVSTTRTAVLFFTTNFVLPSQIISGLMTAQTQMPTASNIIFGINTNNSTSFEDYQQVQLNQLFTTDVTQTGHNLRIAVKMISPLNVGIVTDPLDDEYSSYTGPLWSNVVPFEFINIYDADTYFFKIELYDNAEFIGEASETLYTATDSSAFAIDGVIADPNGIAMQNGETVSVLAVLKGNAAIRCNQYYYAKVSAVNTSNTYVIDDTHTLIVNCNPNFDNELYFDFTNETGQNQQFGFRVMFYADAAQTTRVKTYFSGNDATGWLVNNGGISTSGETIDVGEIVSVSFTPPIGDLTDDTYFLVIDYFDGTDFVNITKSPSIVIAGDTNYSCGEYMNVPIVKDIAIQLQLDEFVDTFGSEQTTIRTTELNQGQYDL